MPEFAANQPIDERDDQTTGSEAAADESSQRQDAMKTESPPQDTMTTAQERIQVIIDAAEKAAAGIIEDAETQARRYLDDSRRRANELAAERAKAISELTDSLISQAETVKRQSDDLISALDDAKGEIGVQVEPPVQIAGSRVEISPSAPMRVSRLSSEQEPQLQAVETPPAEPRLPPFQSAPPIRPLRAAPDPTSQSGGDPAGAIPASAKLLATQMAVAGSSRDEIEGRLRSEYGIDDPGSMLDTILGSEA